MGKKLMINFNMWDKLRNFATPKRVNKSKVKPKNKKHK
jgi:hypothetical protein